MAPVSLVLVWSRAQPRRVGERLLVPPHPTSLGREARSEDQLVLLRPRGRRLQSTGPLASPRLSRRQVQLQALGSGVHFLRQGQRRLLLDGEETDRDHAPMGSTLEIDSEVVFYVEGPWEAVPPSMPEPPWAGPDIDGIIGESAATWRHRRDLDQAGPGHVWIVGDRGSGRLRAARALHRRGPSSPLVAHDTDRIRPGCTVIVPAAQSTPYVGREDLRALVIADPETVPLRVPQRIDVPGLEARRADVPLIARQILLEWTLTEARALARHIDERGEPKLSIELVRHLLAVDLPHNERTLRRLLWESVETSPQSRLAPPGEASNVRSAAWEESFEHLDEP